MDVEKPLAECRVAIVGLGLMGGSLAMGLKGKCSRLLGSDCDPDTLSLAIKLGVVDRADQNLEAILPDADIIVLATPVREIVKLLRLLPEIHPGPVVVVDLGSTKSEVVRAMAALPPPFDPIGGHPICGNVYAGLQHATAGIYEGATFVLTPIPRTTEGGRSAVEALVRAVHALPFWVSADDHDAWLAVTSHLPHLLACALVAITPEQARQVVGPGFSSASRLAASDPKMMADIYMTNREAVLEAMDKVMVQLEALKAEIRDGEPDAIEQRFVDAQQFHRSLVQDRSAV